MYLVPENIALVFIISYGLAVSLLTYRIPCVIFAFASPGISSHYSVSGERLPEIPSALPAVPISSD